MIDNKENKETAQEEEKPDCAAFKAWDNDSDHDFEHVRTMGRCLNQYKCRKCKQFLIIDSGD